MVRSRGKSVRGIAPRGASEGADSAEQPSRWRVWGRKPGQPKYSPHSIFLWGFQTMYEDKTLVCKDCDAEFVFTAGEQEFYAEKGFQNEPTRCKACRQARKASRAAGGPREMHDAICAECGKPTQVPFEPREDRPVYCSECFAARRG